jgi:hypothetical protein
MKPHYFHWIWLSLPLSLLSNQPVSAARLLKFSVELDGRVVLSANHQDNGLADAATVWSYLCNKELIAEAGAKLSINDDDPHRCQLRGAVVIRVMHAGTIIAEGKVNELRLVRLDTKRNKWTLLPAEVERVGQAAGLPSVQTVDSPRSIDPMLIVFVGLTGVVLLICIWTFARGQPTTRVESRDPSVWSA